MRGGIGTAMGNHVLPIVSTASSVLRAANRESVGKITPTKIPKVAIVQRVVQHNARGSKDCDGPK